jgi:hypothetical protein
MVCFIFPICPSLPFPYAPSGLAPYPARTQQLSAEERDCQDQCAKARCCKQRLYNATGNYIPNDSDNNFEDKDDLNIYLAGTVFYALDSVTSCALLARIEQPPAPLPTCKLTACISHLLPPHLLLKRLAPAPGPHASTRRVVPQLSHLN